MSRNNDCSGQRSLLLPGQNRRLSKDEVAEQGRQVLERLSSQHQKRLDPSQAPRRAVAVVTDTTIRLVCNHELPTRPGDTTALTYRCLECQREGRT